MCVRHHDARVLKVGETSKDEAALPGAIRHGLDPSVVEEAALVEHNLLDVERLALLSDGLPDLLRRIDVRRRLEPLLHARGQRRRRAQRVALALVLRVVDHLRVDVVVRTVHREPGPLLRAEDLPTLALVPERMRRVCDDFFQFVLDGKSISLLFFLVWENFCQPNEFGSMSLTFIKF